MANNLNAVIPQLLAQGMMSLREMSIMPRLVNRSYDTLAAAKGQTIDVPIPSAVTAVDVAPANTAPNPGDQAPTSVPIALTQWKEAAFQLSDSELMSVQEGTLPMIASEAIRSLSNVVDIFILDQFEAAFGVAGQFDTIPFADEKVTDAVQARKVLNNQLAPMDPRWAVLNPDAEASALAVPAFHDMSSSGDTQAIIEGRLNRKFGMGWLMDQNIQTHANGSGTGYLVNNVAGYAIGIKSVVVDTGTGTFLVGDIIQFAGHTQTYVVTTGISGAGTVSFEPGLVAAVVDNEKVGIGAGSADFPADTGGPSGSHAINPVFHRDAVAFASRPLASSNHPASIISSVADAVSGLTLRLEVTREYKRDRYSYDILFGAAMVRRELAVRLLGPA